MRRMMDEHPYRLISAGLSFGAAVVLIYVGAISADGTDEAWPGLLILLAVGLVVAGLTILGLTPRRGPVSQPQRAALPTVAGWYPDPETPSLRFWDGSAWTNQRAPLPPPPQQGIQTWQIGLGVAGGLALFVFLFGR